MRGALYCPRPRRSEEGLEAQARSSRAPWRRAGRAGDVGGARGPLPLRARPAPGSAAAVPGWDGRGAVLPFLSLKLSVLQPGCGIGGTIDQH